MHPLRIQRKRTKGFRLPENAVCVTRPGKWGNLYQSAAVFRFWLEMSFRYPSDPESLADPLLKAMQVIRRDIVELRGKQLACWCALGVGECHGDVLAEFANR